MINDLTFNKSGIYYEASFTSGGPAVVEIERETAGPVEVQAYLADMPPVRVDFINTPFHNNEFFKVNIPAGVNVKILSATAVTSAKMLTL